MKYSYAFYYILKLAGDRRLLYYCEGATWLHANLSSWVLLLLRRLISRTVKSRRVCMGTKDTGWHRVAVCSFFRSFCNKATVRWVYYSIFCSLTHLQVWVRKTRCPKQLNEPGVVVRRRSPQNFLTFEVTTTSLPVVKCQIISHMLQTCCPVFSRYPRYSNHVSQYSKRTRGLIRW